MSLTPSIIGHIQRVTELGSQQGMQLHEVRRVAKLLNDQALTRALSELQSLQASLQAECNWLKAEVEATQMTGEYVRPTVEARDMELHPANLPKVGHGRALAMHRLELEPHEEVIKAWDRHLITKELPLPELPPEQEVWTGSTIKPLRSLSAEELMQMQAARHREGDHTLDLDDDDDLIADEEVRP